MDMNHHHHFRPELHIAQQSRRDKLRINQNDSPNHGFYFNNLEQIPNPNDNWRPAAAGNICYDMPVFCSDPTGYQSYDPAADPQYFTTWKSIGSQSSGDWVTNHSNPIPYHDNNNNLASDFSNANYQNALQELVTPSSGVRIGTQALSLSLSSSVPSPRVHNKDICVTTSNVHHHHETGTWKKPEMGRVPGPAQTLNHRNPGPLGPFTGYATILTSSKFLRPAQQLLEELCCMARPKDIEICEDNRSLEQLLRVSNDCNEPSSFFIKDKSREPPPPDSFGPENLQRKAKLLYMQDEVCKRYKQYHQQMQMVVSSFESVAGLSAATPYVSLALKMISKHFRCLKNTITDQLKSIKNSLGEELASPSSSSKGDAGVSMLKFFDQNFQKQKGAAGANLGILETQHIWRPQRGLPERAVSILRAWLFDHFLHPYPTDTDKHMLATQTGLTRNQVSNWFINARVRVWKPMVEEIHMLETKGGVADQTESSSGGKTTLEGCDHQPANDQSSSQSLNRLRMSAISDKQVECSTIGPLGQEYEVGRNIWNQEKRSRIEYQMIPSSIDGSLMGLVPSGIEMGGLGSVSLTLGLRQSAAENAQQRQPEHHLRPHMGGQIIRDFVG